MKSESVDQQPLAGDRPGCIAPESPEPITGCRPVLPGLPNHSVSMIGEVAMTALLLAQAAVSLAAQTVAQIALIENTPKD